MLFPSQECKICAFSCKRKRTASGLNHLLAYLLAVLIIQEYIGYYSLFSLKKNLQTNLTLNAFRKTNKIHLNISLQRSIDITFLSKTYIAFCQKPIIHPLYYPHHPIMVRTQPMQHYFSISVWASSASLSLTEEEHPVQGHRFAAKFTCLSALYSVCKSNALLSIERGAA